MTNREIRAKAREALGGSIFHNNWLVTLLAVFVIGAVNTFAASLSMGVLALLITGPISVGLATALLRQSDTGEGLKFDLLLDGFRKDFAGSFLLALMQTLFVMLWSLLLLIPGIVKAYAYSMAFYIKAEKPQYTWRECLDESRKIMKGNKLKFFGLQLSFIGWMIVGALCFGIGAFWVSAYMEAACAEFYKSIRIDDAVVVDD